MCNSHVIRFNVIILFWGFDIKMNNSNCIKKYTHTHIYRYNMTQFEIILSSPLTAYSYNHARNFHNLSLALNIFIARWWLTTVACNRCSLTTKGRGTCTRNYRYTGIYKLHEILPTFGERKARRRCLVPIIGIEGRCVSAVSCIKFVSQIEGR